MTERKFAFLEVEVFTYLCIYVQYVHTHIQVQDAFVGMGDNRRRRLDYNFSSK